MSDLTFAGLLDRLGYGDDEHVAISHAAPRGGLRIDVVRAADAGQQVAGLPDGVNVWFNVNPTSVPLQLDSRVRGGDGDTTRVAALPVDLDIKPGGCNDLDTARNRRHPRRAA
jgi:hypothetical protein